MSNGGPPPGYVYDPSGSGGFMPIASAAVVAAAPLITSGPFAGYRNFSEGFSGPPGYLRLPGGDYIPKKLIDNFDRCDPAAFDAAVLQNLQLREKSIVMPAGSTGAAIDYDQVPDGFFWYVLAASVVQEFPSSQPMNGAILLMPPSLVNAAPPNLNEQAPTGVVINDNVNLDGTVQAGPNFVHVQRKITVPGGWFLRAALSPGSAASINPVTIAFRIALAQLKYSFANLKS